jgi:PAS domain S-box-containing protein
VTGSKTLRQSLLLSHILTGLLPLALIALFTLLFVIKTVKDDFSVRIDTLSQGTRGQIQLFMGQPLSVLRTIARMLPDARQHQAVEAMLNSHLRDSTYFDSIYLLNDRGRIVNAGLPADREAQRIDLLGINLSHKREFSAVRASGEPQWSDTFLSLSSGKTSLTLYVPAGEAVLAADINLSLLAQLITRLSRNNVVTAVIDRNGAIIIHPDPSMIGDSIMMNDIALVSSALAGDERAGEFIFQGRRYLGATSIIEPTKWVCLFAEPLDHLGRRLLIVLLIFAAGICGAAALSLVFSLYRARSLAAPISEITDRTAIIARGDYGDVLPPGFFVELDQLAENINSMADAIRTRESQLRESELHYRELIEQTSNLVLRLEHDLSISYANHTIVRLTGFEVDEVIGRPLPDFVYPEDRHLLQDAARRWPQEKTTSASLEVRLRHQDDSIRHLLITANIHFDDNHHLIDISIIGHDITVRLEMDRQRRELERQRQQSQRMEMLGLMAGGVAHDLNNIRAGIINYPELLLLKLEPNDPSRPTIEAIRRSGERAVAVVADLLTVARDSAAVHEIVEINDLVGSFAASPELGTIRRHHPDIDFHYTPCPQPIFCSCSPVHIEKAVMNLVINAFEAVERAGRVEIRCDRLDETAARLPPDLAPGPYLRLDVCDTGKGIDAEHLGKIFEPFFSKKRLGRSGTGLGLTVAWSTVREHGGTIEVTSSESGSSFTVYLPIAEAPTPTVVEEEDIVHLMGSGERVLVIDDEQHLREIAVHMLTTLNYQATAVDSGEAALAYLENTPADLLLLDMQMAPGINGRETYARICAHFPGQKAVVVSGYSTNEDVEATLRCGAGAFLKKPYSLRELGRTVQRVLNG